MAGISVKQNDVNVENKLLCLMFKSENIIDMVLENGLTEDNFSFALNKEIFSAILEFYADVEIGGVAIGDETQILYDMLKSGDRDKDKELLVHLNKIKGVKADDSHVRMYIKTLIDLFKIRSIVQASRNITNYLKDNAENVSAEELISIYEESHQKVFEIVLVENKAIDTKDAIRETVEEIIDASSKEVSAKFNLDGVDDYAKMEEGYLTYIVGEDRKSVV